MYLDTKNLTASSTNAAAATVAGMTPRRGRGMRKVWQPLRRLLAVGGKGRPASQPHPNNVDLNNTQLLSSAAPQPLPLLSHTLDSDNENESENHYDTSDSKSTPEESSSKSAEQRLQQVHVDLPPPPNTPTLISSVYVEKARPQSCNVCPHGRNCQHTHHDSSHTQPQHLHQHQHQPHPHRQPLSTAMPAQALWDLPLPLQYISTDNGTFFWANTQERIDDDLLHAWLCQSFSQLPGTLC